MSFLIMSFLGFYVRNCVKNDLRKIDHGKLRFVKWIIYKLKTICFIGLNQAHKKDGRKN